MAHGLGNAAHALGPTLGVVAGQGVDHDEVGTHGTYVVEHHVDHHLEVGAALAYELDEHDAVERAKGVIAHRDEAALGQVVEHLAVVELDGDVQVLEQSLHKGHAGRVAVVGVYPVHLVEGEHMAQEFHQPRLAVEVRYHLAYVVIVQHRALDGLLAGLWGLVVFHIVQFQRREVSS